MDKVIKKHPIDDPDYLIPGGESLNQLKARTIKFIMSLDDHDVLLVGHWGTVRAIMLTVGNISPTTFEFIGRIEKKDGKLFLEIIKH